MANQRVPRPRALLSRISPRVRWFLVVVFLVAVLAVVFSVGLMASASSAGDAWIRSVVDDVAKNQSGIILLGHVFSLDVDERTAMISWLILGCGDFKLPGSVVFSDFGKCGCLKEEVDFYVDGATDPTYSYSFKANPISTQTKSPVFVQAMQGFATEHLLVLYAWKGLDQQYGFPFDGYQLDTTVTAISNTSGQSVPILGVRPVTATRNFLPHLRYDIATTSVNSTDGSPILSRTMEVGFSRTGFEKTYVMTLFLVNWALTAVVAFITVSAWVGQKISQDVLLLPISVILTIPALRALWDGAPAFGLLLDSCGTFLQMVIVSLCSCFLVMQLALNRRAEDDDNEGDHVSRKPRGSQVSMEDSEKPAISQSQPLLQSVHISGSSSPPLVSGALPSHRR